MQAIGKMNRTFKITLRHVKKVYGCAVRQEMNYSSEAGTVNAAPPWDIMFFGTNEFSVASLEALHKEQQKKTGVVGRLEVVTVSLQKPLPAVRHYCRAQDIPLRTWPLTETPRGCDVGVVVSFGHLIPARLIKAFPMGILNVHGSLLPRWRGAAPVIHALLHGDQETGVTLMRIQPHRFDVGSIVSQVVVPVAWDIKSGALTQQLAELGARELLTILHHLPQNLQNATPQPEIGVTKAPKVSANTSRVQWSEHTCLSIQAMFLALDDHFPLWTHWQGTPIKLRGMLLRREWARRFKTETEGCRDEKVLESKEIGVSQALNEYGICTQSKIMQTSNGLESINSHNGVIETQNPLKLDCQEKSSLNNDTSEGSMKESPGIVVYDKNAKVVSVKCKDGWVSFWQVEVKGRKPMSAQDFHNGFISKVPRDHSRFT